MQLRQANKYKVYFLSLHNLKTKCEENYDIFIVMEKIQILHLKPFPIFVTVQKLLVLMH